jgi:cytolysin-activating lysine-acyltransferase
MTDDNQGAPAGRPDPRHAMAVLGSVVLLARASPLHARYRVAQLFDRVMPSLARHQYCLYVEKGSGRPVGFCSWAWVSDAVLAEYLEAGRRVRPDDWDSGDKLFFPEMIAPFGHLRRICADIRDEIVAEESWGYALRGHIVGKDGAAKAQRVMKFKGRGWQGARTPMAGATIRRL